MTQPNPPKQAWTGHPHPAPGISKRSGEMGKLREEIPGLKIETWGTQVHLLYAMPSEGST